jgi:DNA invertase Pin-like site-specific DNA recombinase
MAIPSATSGALVGYARVSTHEQHLDAQISELADLGCIKVFQEKASGARADRPELEAALHYLRAGDVLCVWRLDRLGRSLNHLVCTISELETQGVGLRSIHENIDTTTSTGKLVFHIFAALAEFERDLIIDRTRAGLAAAKERGATPGRKRLLSANQVDAIHQLHNEGKQVRALAEMFGVSRPTVYRALAVAPGLPAPTARHP